ncbi:hypothetical protein DSCA_48740 [Desulfosarcina alkanivorans]|jgi:replicative DNA helicase|uniref:DNA helicase DnaB-like N-terminal domain-containing protein n=1 Tax=Desulfosarcina alkanivorans TaxID=571177 RepID=A0A5K7YXC5_9BACT|nr:DnaB-like helicase N-terminal domain-containing protein [Desulfosarcina alkanivorans]BBO70944.1 hypothetical protein DSCA_48740 [Desulfosarcina alkanivorans]
MATPKTIRLFDEISVLHEIIHDNSQIHKLRECIDPYSVPIKRHGILRRAMAQLHYRQHPIDLASLARYLEDHALLDEIGGSSYLQFIADFPSATSLN